MDIQGEPVELKFDVGNHAFSGARAKRNQDRANVTLTDCILYIYNDLTQPNLIWPVCGDSCNHQCTLYFIYKNLHSLSSLGFYLPAGPRSLIGDLTCVIKKELTPFFPYFEQYFHIFGNSNFWGSSHKKRTHSWDLIKIGCNEITKCKVRELSLRGKNAHYINC